MSTTPSPVAGDVFAGFSFAPLRTKANRVVAASLTEAMMNTAATRLSANAIRFMSRPPVLRLDLPLNHPIQSNPEIRTVIAVVDCGCRVEARFALRDGTLSEPTH